MLLALEEWVTYAPLIVIGSIIGLAVLWRLDGREVVDEIKISSLKQIVTRWSCLKPGQKRYIWLSSVLFTPILTILVFVPSWINILVNGEPINFPMTFEEVFMAQLTLIHGFIFYFYISSLNTKAK